MALLIQLGDYSRQQEKGDRKSCLTADKVNNILLSLKKSLYLGGTSTLKLEKDQRSNRAQLTFTAKVDNNSEVLYRFWRSQSGKIKSRIVLFQKGYYLRVRSNEIKNNMFKTIAYVNSTNNKSQVFLMLNFQSAQFQFANSYYMGSDQPRQTLAANLKSLIGQCLYFAKTFSNLLLYKSNIVNKYAVNLSFSQQVRSYFTAKTGQFQHLSSIHQYLSLANCKIQNSMRQIKGAKIQEKSYNQALNRVIQKYNNRAFPHEIILFSQARAFRRAKKWKRDSDEIISLTYDYKPTQCPEFDNNYIFSTIFFQELDNFDKKQYCIGQSAKAKLLYLKAKIKYGLTSPGNDAYQNTPSTDEQISISCPERQSQLAPASSKSIEKALVIKIPNSRLPPQVKNKVLSTIKYEKKILQGLRTAECIYMPKYYQTSQAKSQYKDTLMMDYVPGATLADLLSAKKQTITLSWKLHFLMHLANAVRFLQSYDIVHLDLSANNIILTAQGKPKIIDFGEAYHQQVLIEFLKQKNAKSNRHIPGRTFPFAPPETTQRNWNFSSKQDIFSIGVIAFRLVLGRFPNSCSQPKIEQLYLKSSYNESIYLSPQGLEWVGQYELMLSCMQLILNCMNINQNVRPNPSWAHILFKKMFQFLQIIN